MLKKYCCICSGLSVLWAWGVDHLSKCLFLGVFLRKLKIKAGILSAYVCMQVECWLIFMKWQCNLIKRICILWCEWRWFGKLEACLRDKHQSCHASHLRSPVMHQAAFTKLWTLKCQNNAFAITGSFLIKNCCGMYRWTFPPSKCFSVKSWYTCRVLRHNLLCLILNQLALYNLPLFEGC